MKFCSKNRIFKESHSGSYIAQSFQHPKDRRQSSELSLHSHPVCMLINPWIELICVAQTTDHALRGRLALVVLAL